MFRFSHLPRDAQARRLSRWAPELVRGDEIGAGSRDPGYRLRDSGMTAGRARFRDDGHEALLAVRASDHRVRNPISQARTIKPGGRTSLGRRAGSHRAGPSRRRARARRGKRRPIGVDPRRGEVPEKKGQDQPCTLVARDDSGFRRSRRDPGMLASRSGLLDGSSAWSDNV